MCTHETTTGLRTSARSIILLAIVLSLAAGGLIAQALFPPATELSAQVLLPSASELVAARAVTSLSVFHPGSYGYLAVTADIIEGWHINSNTPRDEFLIPTVLEVTAPEGIAIERILYPEPALERLSISEDLMSLYHGRVNFGARLTVAATTPPGTYTIRAALSYQGCNDMTCIEPASVSVEATITVGGLEETTEMIHTEIFSKPPFTGAGAAPGTGEAGDMPEMRGAGDAEGVPVPGGTDDVAGAARERDTVSGIIEERGLFLAFVFIFIAGLALNLTPCIYPLIPITVSYFGGQAGGKTSRSFLLALVYVLGMSITYSILGVFAAITGNLFGSALQNPWVILFIAVVLVGLAASMFGLWEIRMPAFLTSRTGTARQGYVGALFMGLTVGVLAAPCIGPFVLGLLTYVGNLGRPVMGFLMFFTLAWGMGLPFLVLGTVSGSISRLPRSGNWMIWIRKVFGFVLITMAVYFARPIIGPLISTILYAAVAVIAGIYLGWIERTAVDSKIFLAIRRIFGVVCISGAILMVALPGGPLRHREATAVITWIPFSEQALAEAASSGKPVIIDFTADWCIPCHELERRTFSDPRVVTLAGRFVPLRADMTRLGDAEKQTKERYRVMGVPTIVFIDGAGSEYEDLRVTGFLGPGPFSKILEQASGNNK